MIPRLNKSLQIFSLVLTVLFLLQPAAAQVQKQVILHVQDLKNAPISEASVYINNKLSGFTDGKGNYKTPSLTKDLISLKVKALGYKVYSTEIHADTVSPIVRVRLEEADDNLQDIIVTAGRRAENISTVPSSVTILTRKDIETQAQITTNLASILGNSVPGLAPSSNKATNAGQTLRGRSVLVLVDGIPQSTPLMNGQRDIRSIDPAVIDRIEVIKGATSIYGNGSAGGIINYITKKADNDTGSLNSHTVIRGTLNPVHPEGTTGYRASQRFSGKMGKWNYVTSATMEYTGVQRDGKGEVLGQTDALSNSYQYNLFAKLGYQISKSSSITGFYNFYSSTSHAKYITQSGLYGNTPAIGIPGEDPGKPAGTPFNHNARLTYTKNELFGTTTLDVTAYLNSFRSMNRYVASATAWYGPGQTKINSRKKGLRINLNTPFAIDGRLAELTYGLDALSDITNQDLVDGRIYIPNMKMINIAPYAQFKWDIIQSLVFKAGMRYENARVTIKDFNTIAKGPDGEGSIFVNGGKIPYKGMTYNAGLRYNKYKAFNPFVSFSQGFAINELGRIVRRATKNDLDSLKTDPIITNNYEAGFSSQAGIFTFTGAYFISTSKLGVELVDVGGYFAPQRLPENIKGFEVSIDIKPSDIWKFGGSYAYTEGKSKNDDGSKNYLNGARIAPPIATGYLDFTPGASWSVRLFWNHSGNRNRFEKNAKGAYNLNEGPVSSIDLFNLTAAYKVNKRLQVGLGIENLLNKTYYTVVSQYYANNDNYFRGPGLNAALNLTYDF
ncbi:iron complex outermembrane recepter protein [Arachidicoccus rhizosphaerae]|uniref:Iron complex outermembrane recepter protein n=1 Tax=Arachidicoccus rhizosphaerae TaxID=551991 RepID=A0A1H3XW70_9BACT|nr:TonB-dependent receptor [Arachidicoccus rhizosphaerae]SEA02812.1 iron complex outermembrane recepter protein [Arachidicoccus rhizosphaerae]